MRPSGFAAADGLARHFLVLTNCIFQAIGVTFASNGSTTSGGGISVNGAFAAFYEASFVNNTAYTSSYAGPALSLSSAGRLFLGRDTIVRDNVGRQVSGISVSGPGNLTTGRCVRRLFALGGKGRGGRGDSFEMLLFLICSMRHTHTPHARGLQFYNNRAVGTSGSSVSQSVGVGHGMGWNHTHHAFI